MDARYRNQTCKPSGVLIHNVMAVMSNPSLENRLISISELFSTRRFLGTVCRIDCRKAEAVLDF